MPSEREEFAYWEDQLVKQIRGELDTVQTAASHWSTLFTAVLGIFGTVAFAGGLTAMEDLSPALQPWIKWITLAAASATLAAIVFASRASGTMPARTDDTTWDALRLHSEQAAQTALEQLRWAKLAGLLAGLLVLGGSAAILLTGPAKETSSMPYVVAVVNGNAVCGQLNAGPPLTVGSTTLVGVTSVIVVPSCP